MSDLYNTIDGLCQDNKISITKMCKESGVSRGSLTDLKNGRIQDLSSKTLSQIANYFGVSTDYLLGIDLPYCPLCGLTYSKFDKKEIEFHNTYHKKWKDAVNKYGFCWSFLKREKRHDYRLIEKDANNDIKTRIEAAVNVIKCYFSRSLQANDYSLDHILFEEYASKFLYSQKSMFTSDVYEKLVNEFGTAPGLNGTYYEVKNISKEERNLPTNYIPMNHLSEKQKKPLAEENDEEQIKVALFGSSEGVTDEMWEDVKRYAKFRRESK